MIHIKINEIFKLYDSEIKQIKGRGCYNCPYRLVCDNDYSNPFKISNICRHLADRTFIYIYYGRTQIK